MGEMAAGLLFRLWREHPDLEPPQMSGGPSAYNGRNFQMPPEVADDAINSLQRAAEIMARVATLLSQEADPAERAAYAAELARVNWEIQEAERGVERRSKPMAHG